MNYQHIIQIDDDHRSIDVTNDLIPIDEIKQNTYAFKVPTIVPENWQKYEKMSQEEYSYEFYKMHPIPIKVLKNTSNMVVAGGAAAKPLFITKKNIFTDVDIFIYGILDELTFWEKINEIVFKLITLTLEMNNKCYITQKMKRGIVIIGVSSPDGQLLIEYQIILRMYHTLSSILHAFDIPSCCVAFDGHVAYTTTIGAFAHSNQINLINTKQRSTTYEKRLSKYFARGFGIGFMETYNVNKAYRNGLLNHDNLYMTISSRDENKFIGHVGPNYLCSTRFNSDYANIKPKCRNYSDLLVKLQNIEDIGIIISSRTNKPIYINYAQFYEKNVSDLIKIFPNIVGDLITKQRYKILNIQLAYINNMDFPKIVIKDIIDIIINDDPDMNEKIDNILREQIQFISNYEPSWIIVQDPQQQYTASINPIIKDAKNWYGQDYCD